MVDPQNQSCTSSGLVGVDMHPLWSAHNSQCRSEDHLGIGLSLIMCYYAIAEFFMLFLCNSCYYAQIVLISLHLPSCVGFCATRRLRDSSDLIGAFSTCMQAYRCWLAGFTRRHTSISPAVSPLFNVFILAVASRTSSRFRFHFLTTNVAAT